MSQSRGMSGVEAASNVAVGFGVALGVQVVAFPAFGLHPGPAQHLGLAGVFTLASLIRSYLLRRLFERLAGATHGGPGSGGPHIHGLRLGRGRVSDIAAISPTGGPRPECATSGSGRGEQTWAGRQSR